MPRVKVNAAVLRDHREGSTRINVPFEVRQALGARAGDELVFEQGSIRAVEEAAMRGTYFVVSLRRAATERKAEVAGVVPAPVSQPSAPLEPLEAAVRRKLRESKGDSAQV